MILCIYIFIIGLLSGGAFAAGYMPEENTGDCNKPVVAYTRKPYCEKVTGKTCVEIISSYDCSYTELVDNYENGAPIKTENEVEACSGLNNCSVIRNNKLCTDPLEFSEMDAEYTKVFCSKITGYEQVLSGKKQAYKQVEKDAHDADKAAKEAEKEAKKIAHEALKDKLKADIDLTKEELRAYLLKLSGE